MPPHNRPPLEASSLGYLGLVPFVALAVATVASPEAIRAPASFALLAYGATILSFLGGIHWGLAIASHTLSPRVRAFHMVFGVTPQLLGWVALLVPSPWGHVIGAASFLAFLAVDYMAVRSAIAPSWFMQLRWPLSCAAATALTVASL